MDISEVSDAFYDGNRTSALSFVYGDVVRVHGGSHAGREGTAMELDCATAELSIVVDFGGGSAELIPVSGLELVTPAS